MSSPPQTLLRIFDHIDLQREVYIKKLLQYLRQPSVSVTGEGMTEAAKLCREQMEEVGLSVQILRSPAFPVLLGHTDRVKGPTVLFYGHYDVQPVDPIDEWTTPPFEPSIRNGKVYARGAADNKGQHLAQLFAIQAVSKVLGRLPCSVKFLIEGEEETGSPHLADVVRQNADALDCNLVVTSDGPVRESGKAQILFGVRGMLSFELRLTRAKTDLHCGKWGGIAPNPLWDLIYLLASMRNDQGEVLVEGFYDDVEPHTSSEVEAYKALAIDEEKVKQSLGICAFDTPHEKPLYERASKPTFSITGLHGGYGGPGAKAVLPRFAMAKCDIRLVEVQNPDTIFELITRHVRSRNPDVEVIRYNSVPPSKTPLDAPYATSLRNALFAVRNEEPLIVPPMGASLPEYVWTKILGVPSFVIPYANPDAGNHAPNENLDVSRFIEGIKIGAAMIWYLGNS